MAIGANSYGSVTEIGALVPRWSGSAGDFASTTRPNLATVESLVDQVSGLLNSILATNGFTVPISQADAKLMLDMFVNDEVAAIIEGINGSGRFGPTTKGPSGSRFALIMNDVETFVAANAIGIERLGAARTYSITAGIAFRSADEAGDDTFPIFQRKSFGGETFEDADTD